MNTDYNISARLGARFAIVWDAQGRCIRHSGLGEPYCRAAQLKVGVDVDKAQAFLPFCSNSQQFSSVEHRITATSHLWKGFMPATGIELEFEVVSPFFPQNQLVSTAPVFLIQMKVRHCKDFLRQNQQITGSYVGCPKHTRGRLFFAFCRDDIQPKAVGDRRIAFDYRQDVWQIDPTWNTIAPDEATVYTIPQTVALQECIEAVESQARCSDGGFVFDFDLENGQDTLSLLWVSHCRDGLIQSVDGPSTLIYTEAFATLDVAADYARMHRQELLNLSRKFDRLMDNTGLGKTFTHLFAHAFSWYLANTWWLRNKDGRPWFTVTEGKCLFLSTVDVEYNIAPFYLAFWPELLKMQLERWTTAITPDKYLCHDIGRLPDALRAYYPHPMPCEENSNYILMLAGYLAVTGDGEFMATVYPAFRAMVEYLLAADTTGNGFVNVGTANTFDDAPASVQFAAENVYLSVKVYLALCCAAQIARNANDMTLEQACVAHGRAFETTFETHAWLSDHYAVFLPGAACGSELYSDDEAALVGAAQALPPPPKTQPMTAEGYDDYSPYTANGLFYAELADVPHNLNRHRLRQDLLTAYEQTLTEYGCAHSARHKENSNIWISQNLWRDAVAGYLGIDLTRELGRYLAFEQFANSGSLKKGFIDTYGFNNLHSYPRGLAICALLFSMRKTRYSLQHKQGRTPDKESAAQQ